MSFDLKKFLTENKLTKTAKISENTEPLKSLENWRDNLGPNFKIDPTTVNRGPRYLRYAKEVFEADPNIPGGLEGERQILKMGYEFYKRDSGVKTARYYHLYDEDYPSDLVSDYYELQQNAAKTNEVATGQDSFSDEEVVNLAFKAGEYVMDAKEALLDAAVGYSGGVPRKVVEKILYNYDLSLEDFLSDLADDQEYDQEQDQWRDDPYNYIDQKFSDNHFDDLMENKNNFKQNNMSFDLKKFLTENKLTKTSRLAENDLAFEAEEMQAPIAEEPAAEGVDVSRYLNLESADDVVKEIESEVSRVTMEAKIAKIKEVIEAIETKANGLEEDANLEGFVNPARIKEMRRMTKKLRMMQERYTKEYERKYKDVKKKK